jgi:hypothetical protein
MGRLLLFAFFATMIIAIMVFVPFAFIWGINTLFATNIAYTFTNWIASLVLLLLFGNRSGVSIKKETKQKCCSKND